MHDWLIGFKESVEGMGATGSLIGLAIFAALAQAASSDRLSLRDLLIGAPMSGFVIWMAWVGLSNWEMSEQVRIFWSGVAAFGAQWILRGMNVLLRKFAEDPVGSLNTLKSFWRKE